MYFSVVKSVLSGKKVNHEKEEKKRLKIAVDTKKSTVRTGRAHSITDVADSCYSPQTCTARRWVAKIRKGTKSATAPINIKRI